MPEHFIINNFTGEIPKLSPRLLSEPQAQRAENSRLESGELETWQGDFLEEDLGMVGDIKTIYKYGGSWIALEQEVDFAKAPIIADKFDRIVLTGLDKPRVTDTSLVLPNAPFKSLLLGIPSPTSNPTVVLGSIPSEGELQDTAWVYTYVREWSDGKVDEGPPSPPTDLKSLKYGQEATITFPTELSDEDDYGIKKKRIYRTNTNSKGVAQFQYVGEVAFNATTFVDNKKSDELGEVLPSSNWKAPDDDMRGIVTIGTGMLAGFTGNTIHLSEQFQAHGWPTASKFTVDHTIVGLGSFQNTLIVLTEGFPYLVTVTDPDTFSVVPFKELLPCMSHRSIVSTAYGVVYAAHNGLVMIDQRGPRSVTKHLFNRRQWETFDPTSIIGLYHDNKYYTFWKASVPFIDDTLTVTLTEIRGGFIIDPFVTDSTVSRINIDSDAIFRSIDSNDLYYTVPDEDGHKLIFRWEGVEYKHKHYAWKSKEFTSSSGACNLSAARVLADYKSKREKDTEDYDVKTHYDKLTVDDLMGEYGAHEIARFEVAGDRLQEIRQFLIEQPILKFTMYVDGEKKFEKIVKNNRVFRLPAGLRGKLFEFEVEGNIPVWQIQAATSAAEIV